MIRTAFSKAIVMAAVALFAGGTVVSCSKSDTAQKTQTSSIGSVGLSLKLNNGADVTEVAYTVSGNGITPITKTIAVTDPNATVSIFLSGLPAGTGYKIDLSGTSTDGKTTCAGTQTFGVVANSTTQVSVVLLCRSARTTGTVIVNGTVDVCPVLTSLSVAPLTQSVGFAIDVGATASDSDAGDVLTFAWSAPSGSFAAPTAAVTKYNCAAAGPQVLTVKVSDGKCEDEQTIPVNCVPASTPVVCGDGKVEGAETCDPPNGTTCSATCQTITPIVCGDGKIEGSETCEPPNTATCSATCTIIDVDPLKECNDCIAANCMDPEVHGCNGPGFTAAQVKACTDLLTCTVKTACATGEDPTFCFCGSANESQCIGTGADGPCKTESFAAAPTGTTAEELAGRFFDPTIPLGRAYNTNVCAATACKAQCKLK